jgi:hypothetical protein
VAHDRSQALARMTDLLRNVARGGAPHGLDQRATARGDG